LAAGTGLAQAVRMTRAVLLLLVLSACGVPGEGAQMRFCPEEEVCADPPDAIHGLSFTIVSPSREWITFGQVAVGSTATVTVSEAGLSGDPPFVQPFDATSGGRAFDVVGLAPPVVRVHAASEGTAYLRILEPNSQRLYERIEIRTAAVRRLVLSAFTQATNSVSPRPSLPVVLWAGATVPLTVVLEDDFGEAVVDEGLAIQGGRQQAWDTIEVDGPTDFAATTSAGLTLAQRIETTQTVDEIALVSTLHLANETIACFRALSGGALVVGAPWTFSGPGVQPDQDCAIVRGAGAIPVDVQVGGASLHVVVTVVSVTP
jgi:hypothetical protein